MTIIDQNIQHEVFAKTLDLRELQRSLEQRVQYMEVGPIGDGPGTSGLHATEVTYADATIRATAPWTPPQFQLGHLGWTVMDEIIRDILSTQPVVTHYYVVKVIFEAVMVLRDSGGALFCGNGMATHRVYF